jgi:hypothetical protein
LRCVIIQKGCNIRKGYCFHNNLVQYRRRRRQQGWGQTFSKIWLPKFFSVKSENFGGKVMRGPSVFLVTLSCVIVKSSSSFCATNVSYLTVCPGRFDVVLWRKWRSK